MNSILSLIITLTASVFSGIVVFLFKNTLKRQQEKEEMREKEKATETALILRSLIALGKLTVANTLALRDGKSRKEINEALTRAIGYPLALDASAEERDTRGLTSMR